MVPASLGRTVMTGTGDEPSTTNGLQYPMVELYTGGMIMPLMFINAAATCYPAVSHCTAGIHGGMDAKPGKLVP